MGLDKFFNPRSIAVFGASRSPEKPGRVVLRNLIYNNFPGEVYPVNPKADELDGKKVYTAENLPDTDLGIFVIPAPIVPEVLNQARDRLGAALIMSGGFGESGNKQLDDDLVGAADGLRVWGPNCLGLINTHRDLSATFLPRSRMPVPPEGKVSILSQSGATVASILDWAGTMDLGVSKVASYGNQLDVSDYEILEYFMEDDETDTIGFYVEGLKDGRRLLEVARGGDKPVVVLKAGRTDAGISAAKSHTGALAGNYRVFRGVTRQLGWGMAQGPEEFLLSLKVHHLWKRRVRRIGIVTCGGGFGVMASDALEDIGMELASFSDSTLKKLREFPSRVSVDNPVDLTGDSTPQDFDRALTILHEALEVEGIVAIILMQLPKLDEKIAAVMRKHAQGDKPLVVVSPPGKYASGVNELMREVPLVSEPGKAAGVLSTLSK